MSSPNDPLDPLLNRWSEIPEPSSRLSREVWQRIALTETAPQPSISLRSWLDRWFARPSLAVVFLASCALLGLFLAELRVNARQRERDTQLAQSYLRLIDPLLNARDGSPRS